MIALKNLLDMLCTEAFEQGVAFPDFEGPRDKHRIPLDVRADIGAFLHAAGARPSVSTFIDDETITHGYGRLSEFGDWEYPVLHLDYVYMRGLL